MAGKHDFCCSFVLPACPPSLSLRRGGRGWKDKNPMPPKAAREGSIDKPEMGIMALHRKCTTEFHLSRVAGLFFLSFLRKLRKRNENPIDPVNPVR